jgi:outer membrane receptor protein involved in Fe transport
VSTTARPSAIGRAYVSSSVRSLAFGQLVGEHRLAEGGTTLTWQGNIARTAQHEPDTRDLLRTQTADGRYAIDHGSGSAERLFADLGDTSGGGGADVSVPLGGIKLKAGASLSRSARTYQARRFHFDVTGDAIYEDPETAMASDSMSMIEATLPTDGYVATRTIGAGYALADAAATDKLRVLGGARFEQSDLDVGLDSRIDLMVAPTPHTRHATRDVLPAVNTVYALTPSTNLRAAYALTVVRPNFREIAPALYYDYVRRRAIGGNPDLLETRIHNADLRWETFLGESEVLAASVFAKHFLHPIEQTIEDAGDGQNVGFANAAAANSYGVELEARVSLARVTAALAGFTAGGNLSLIGSRIDLMGASRPLQGQSPYVANADLGYAAKLLKIDLLYNVFGRRIEEVGTGGAGNVYEEPVHRLDLAVSRQLQKHTKLKLAASNLLDQRVVRSQNGVEILSYRPGIAAFASIELFTE